MKIFKNPGSGTEEKRQFESGFLREVGIWSGLAHANIVKYFGWLREDDYYGILSELAHCGTLKQRLHTSPTGRLSWSEAGRLLVDVLRGLRALHHKAVVHRDLKPENVLLFGKTAKLADFGLAHLFCGLSPGSAAGTPSYMAPEARIGLACPQSDLWSAGVILHEMLTGSYLLPTAHEDLPFADYFGLTPVVERALRRELSDRFRDAEEMLDLLERVLGLADDGAATKPISIVSSVAVEPLAVQHQSAQQVPSPEPPQALTEVFSSRVGAEPAVQPGTFEHASSQQLQEVHPRLSSASTQGPPASETRNAVAPFPPGPTTPRAPGYPPDRGTPDLWTPGATRHRFLVAYERLVGSALAEALLSCSQEATKAVADGDFAAQRALGRRVQMLCPDLPTITGAGSYFEGEGNRLLADLQTDPLVGGSLLDRAKENYAQASALLGDDPRPLRGLGRILESEGDLGRALPLLREARYLSLLRLTRSPSADALPSLAHEALRSTRHFIHCVLEIRATNALSEWRSERKMEELEGFIAHCDNLHRDRMHVFKAERQWWSIEWFMGLVFLAKAWSAIGRRDRFLMCLIHALFARRQLIQNRVAISPVERINLKWWLQVGLNCPELLDRGFVARLEAVASSLATQDDATTLGLIDDILARYLPPWETPLLPTTLSGA